MAKRNGNIFANIDLYNYILKGDIPNNIQLRDQDVIFVPVRLSSVVIDSNVFRPGIYESRPNVTADASALALKSGNSIILRGGSESFNSSSAIVASIKNGLKESAISDDCVQIVNTTSRDAVGELLKMNKYINLIIPRGGKSLISRVQLDSKIAVLSHLDGLCHTYIDKDADKEMSMDIVINATSFIHVKIHLCK